MSLPSIKQTACILMFMLAANSQKDGSSCGCSSKRSTLIKTAADDLRASFARNDGGMGLRLNVPTGITITKTITGDSPSAGSSSLREESWSSSSSQLPVVTLVGESVNLGGSSMSSGQGSSSYGSSSSSSSSSSFSSSGSSSSNSRYGRNDGVYETNYFVSNQIPESTFSFKPKTTTTTTSSGSGSGVSNGSEGQQTITYRYIQKQEVPQARAGPTFTRIETTSTPAENANYRETEASRITYSNPIVVTSTQSTTSSTGSSSSTMTCGSGNTQPDYSTTNPLCAEFRGQVCVRCAQRSYMGDRNICVAVDSQCNDYDPQNGRCRSCYPGYSLTSFGKCIKSPEPVEPTRPFPPVTPGVPAGDTDPLCAQFVNGKCVKCAWRAYFRNGKCAEVDPQCNTWDQSSGDCTSCYGGYALSAGKCIAKQNNCGCH